MKASWLIKVVSLAAVAVSSAALGASDGFEAPDVEPSGTWFTYLCTIVFIVAIATVAFKSSKRTHLD